MYVLLSLILFFLKVEFVCTLDTSEFDYPPPAHPNSFKRLNISPVQSNADLTHDPRSPQKANTVNNTISNTIIRSSIISTTASPMQALTPVSISRAVTEPNGENAEYCVHL